MCGFGLRFGSRLVFDTLLLVVVEFVIGFFPKVGALMVKNGCLIEALVGVCHCG